MNILNVGKIFVQTRQNLLPDDYRLVEDSDDLQSSKLGRRRGAVVTVLEEHLFIAVNVDVQQPRFSLQDYVF